MGLASLKQTEHLFRWRTRDCGKGNQIKKDEGQASYKDVFNQTKRSDYTEEENKPKRLKKERALHTRRRLLSMIVLFFVFFFFFCTGICRKLEYISCRQSAKILHAQSPSMTPGNGPWRDGTGMALHSSPDAEGAAPQTCGGRGGAGSSFMP